MRHAGDSGILEAKTGVILVSVTHAPPAHVRRLHVNLWLVAVIVLSAALTALAAWVIIDAYRGGDTATEDAATLIDDANAAWSAGDAATVASLYAKDAVLVRDDGGQTGGSGALGGLASFTARNIDYRVKRVAPVSLEGDFATTFMKYTSALADGTLIGVYQFEGGRITRQWIFKLGVTSPFQNAVIP